MARSEQSTRAREIFESALDIASAEERAAYVKSACGGDAALLERVQALLQADHVADSFLPNEPLASRVIASLEESPGTVIGRYKLLEKIGEGGMGVVYMAEQEEPVRRKVALKIIRLGMDTKSVVARFEAERQALALMDHPNIAKVFDAGLTEPPHLRSGVLAPEMSRQPVHPLPSSDEGRGQGEGSHSSTTRPSSLATHYGRPYFVMELVQGVPITEFCDKNQLSTEERLKLFIPVCQAIQSAHQKGIIHRDLKPSNVLVTLHDGVPVPKVIDFGVAKAINQKLTEKTLFTNFATMIGTPAYMSPEQAEMSGLDIDTRSDIYSLGVLLYELLTGTTPFPEQRQRSVAYSEMQRIILEEEPERPSTRLKKKRATVAATLRASKAAPSPRPSPPVGERVSEGRVRGTSEIDADLDWIVMKCLEKDRSRRYETANALAGDIQRHLDNEPVIARPPSAAYRFQKMVRRNKVQFAAATFAVLVLILAVAVSSWQAVRATRAEGKAEEQARVAKEQAETARSVKNFLTAQLLGTANPFVEPETDPNKGPLLERIARQVEGQFSGHPLIEAEIRHALGDAFKEIGEWAKSAVQFEKCLELRRRVLTLSHSDTLEAVAWLAEADIYLGRKFAAQKLLTEAIAVARGASQILTHGAAEVLFVRGWRLNYDGRSEQAMPYIKEALASFRAALGDDHLRVSAGRFLLAACTHGLGRLREAELLFEEGIRDCVRIHRTNHPLAAVFLKGYALVLIQEGRFDDAIAKLESAVSIQRQIQGPDNAYTLESEGYIANALEKKGDVDGAVARNLDLHRRWAQHLPYDQARMRLRNLADFFIRNRRYLEAKAVFADLRKALTDVLPERPDEFEMLLRATAALEGWPAAAEVCQANFDRFSESLSTWLNKAWVFRYVGDEGAYRKVVTIG